jgi:Protein of unknown function (DUF2971)
MNDIEYVREQDKQEYLRFFAHHLRSFGRPPASELWHYTDAEGLMGIVASGQLWCTQVACLNDSLEQRYFGDLMHAAVKARRANNTDPDLAILLRAADEFLDGQDFATAGRFVACFSEIEDDLGQWRGYGGGQCGYAIGFRSNGIVEALKARPSTFLLRMHYEDVGHQCQVNDVLHMGQQYFFQGVQQRGLPDIERWSREFLAAFAMALDPLAAIIKHPKFSSEKEHRIVTHLQPGEHTQLNFRQRRTLLARHLPIGLKVGTAKLLPLTRVYVGPGPTQRVSQVSVGDLLRKHGYEGLPIELSKVPYRVP